VGDRAINKVAGELSYNTHIITFFNAIVTAYTRPP
jgi:hypothetical protein